MVSEFLWGSCYIAADAVLPSRTDSSLKKQKPYMNIDP